MDSPANEARGGARGDMKAKRIPFKWGRSTKGFRKFFIHVSGNTLGCHGRFTRKLERKGLKQVDFRDDCDVIVVFCPVSSRVGTDIECAMEQISVGKPVVLVMLHPTCDENSTVRCQEVKEQRVLLTVDCLFHEDRGLFDCQQNEEALEKVVAKLRTGQNNSFRWKCCLGDSH